MINIFKSSDTQYVYIQGVEHSFAENFEYVRDGDLFTISTKYTDVIQVCELPFSEFTGKDAFLTDITFADADEFEAYLIVTFTQLPIGGGSGVYGTQLQLFMNMPVLTNNTTTPLDVINDTTTSLPVGTYEIEINYGWNHNSTQRDFRSYFFFDGAAIGVNPSGLIHRQEPKDAAGDFMGTGSAQQYNFYKKFIVDVTVAGPKDVQLSFDTDRVNRASSIFETIIKIKRIA